MLCEGLCQSVGFASDAYWKVFSSEGSCDFAVQSVRDERDLRFWGRLLSSMVSSEYPLRRSMTSNSGSCLKMLFGWSTSAVYAFVRYG